MISINIGKFLRSGKANPVHNNKLSRAKSIHCDEDVLVYPFESLLQAPNGKPEYQGGPSWKDWSENNQGRFFRQGRAIDVVPSSRSSPKHHFKEGFWCGPICNHFGHQIADFSTRIVWYADAIRSGKIAAIPFVFARSPHDAGSPLPSFFVEVCEWFGVDQTSLMIVDEHPVHFDRLYYAPQGEQVGGPGPSKKYLKKLLSNQQVASGHESKEQDLPVSGSKLFLSRAAMRTGKIAGESAVEAILTASEFTIVRPELLSLREQLSLYAKASSIFAFEGSAVHALQLFGGIPAKLCIVPRIRGNRIAAQHLRPRVSSLRYTESVGHSIVPMNKEGSSLTWEGISFLDLDLFFNLLHDEYQLDSLKSGLYPQLFHLSEAIDLQSWFNDMIAAERILTNQTLDSLADYLRTSNRVQCMEVLAQHTKLYPSIQP
jgi:hypothetical protein